MPRWASNLLKKLKEDIRQLAVFTLRKHTYEGMKLSLILTIFQTPIKINKRIIFKLN
jgi:hypothetical protein